jgi:hypothetical protein
MNQIVDKTADFLAAKPGPLPMVAIALLFLNFILQIYPGSSYWIADSVLLLHFGLVTGFIGLLLIRAFGRAGRRMEPGLLVDLFIYEHN